jgi:hypothetical protein
VRAQVSERQVDVLAFDFIAEGEAEGTLDEFWALGATKCAKRIVTLVAGSCSAEFVKNNVVLEKS